MRSRRNQILLILGLVMLVILAFVGLAWANLVLTTRYPGGEAFLVPWMGLRGFMNGSGPYSAGIAQDIQLLLHDQMGQAGYPYFVDIPFYLLLLYLPFGWFSNFAVARAIWMAGLELATVGALLLNIRLTNWQLSRPMLGAVLILTMLSFYNLFPLMRSDAVFWLALIFAGTLLALRAGLDEVAGALLVLCTYKWELTGLFFLLVFIWTVSHRRWRVWSTFLMVLLVLLALAFITYPGWFLPFLRAVLANLRAGYGFTPAEVFSLRWPDLGNRLGWGLTIILGIVLFLEWRAARLADFRHFLWVVCLTLAATPLIGFRSNPAEFPLLLLALVLIMQVASERWKRLGRVVALMMLTGVLSAWYLYWRALENGLARPEITTYLLLPSFLLIALYWLRWWAIQPPRIWFDQIKENRQS